MKIKLPLIDLFAGCGGLSLGLEQAGFTPVYVNELNKDAMATYLENRKENALLNDKRFNSNDIYDLTSNKNNLSKYSEIIVYPIINHKKCWVVNLILL